MQDPLSLDMQGLQKKATSDGLRDTLGNSRPITPWNTDSVRTPWDAVPEKVLNGGNFFFTINPDPNVSWYDGKKKTIVGKFLTLMEKLKKENTIKKSISVYEYGKYGAKHGKLHFHGFILTTDKELLEKDIYKVFNERANARHRTLNLKTIKSRQDRENMQNYLKKEQQNKLKCLYYN